MIATSRREWIRQRAARFPRTLHVSQGSRGVYVGQIGEAIKAAAGRIGLPVNGARDVRLLLARAVYGREIGTYNELSDAELWALHQWVLLSDVAIRELEGWLKANYGEQLSLLQEAV
jgi:hypothetical protein